MPNGNHLIGQKISYYLLAHFRFFQLDLPEIAIRFLGGMTTCWPGRARPSGHVRSQAHARGRHD